MKKIFIFLFVILCFGFIKVSAEEVEIDANRSYYYEDVHKTDESYTDKKDIKQGDPHFGWKLGKFIVSGFTDKREDSNGQMIFLKNVGDKITLSFVLLQDIDKLNGNEDLSINDDAGYDNEFGIDKTEFGRGYLIVRKIDPNGNKNDANCYENYLKGITVGANTKVDVYEEGDYEVALDYEIRDDGFLFFNSYPNYRIRFNFKVRNGNAMGFVIDLKTNSELYNGSVTENGFYINLVNSQYLQVNIKREIYVKTEDGYTTDVRFNRPAKDGDKFDEEGIYTITYENIYNGDPTIKKIYIGNDKVLKAYVKSGKELNEILELEKMGAKIDDNGNITNIPKDKSSNNNSSDKDDNKLPFIISISVIGTLVILFIIIEVIKTKRIKKKAKEIAEYNKKNPDPEEAGEKDD